MLALKEAKTRGEGVWPSGELGANEMSVTQPFKKLALVIIVLAVLLVVMIEVEEKRRPMNILLFYADDWCHDMLGAAGNPIVKTPVLDAIAAEEGVRFSKNCITMSICWISRTTLYCGQYLTRHHLVMP